MLFSTVRIEQCEHSFANGSVHVNNSVDKPVDGLADKPIDKRNKLDEQVFSFSVSKDNKVFLFYHGKRVIVLDGDKARQFLNRIAGTEGKEAQLIMAKATGNFKRGNEKINKRK